MTPPLRALLIAALLAAGCVHLPKRCVDPETCEPYDGCTEAEQQSDPEYRVCQAMVAGMKYGFGKGVEACVEALKAEPEAPTIPDRM